MAKEMEFFSFLMEQYAAYKGTHFIAKFLKVLKRNKIFLIHTRAVMTKLLNKLFKIKMIILL